ncbi:MAG TPA: CDP-alcohol phosphatidyltransferase family protein [Acidobacteriota bacterium]|nr:CDP-alcohol phosphatidyltransferase family protein [Acidobacteriota bacterium]
MIPRKGLHLSAADWATASRIALTLPITFALAWELSGIALVLYLLAPVSDLIDGPLARRSERPTLGPAFDGVADVIFAVFGIGWAYWKLPLQRPWMEIYLALLLPLAAVYALVCWRKTGRVLLLHLWSGKLMGWAGFLWFGLAYWADAGLWTVHLAAWAALFHYSESLIYILRGRRDPDGRSAFS